MAATRMRPSALGTLLLGALFVFGAIVTTGANLAMRNPIEDGFLLGLLAFGLGGAIVMLAGVVLAVRDAKAKKVV